MLLSGCFFCAKPHLVELLGVLLANSVKPFFDCLAQCLLLFTAALGQLGYARRHPVQTLFLGLRDLIDGLGEGTTEVLKVVGDLLTKGFGSEPGICLQFAELCFDIRPQNLLTAFIAFGQRGDLTGDAIEFSHLAR
jgi:hypothetical protein